MKLIIILGLSILMSMGLFAQTNYYGMTSSGGVSNEGTIFKTDTTGGNLQTVFNFEYYHAGRTPNSVFTQASNGKIYGTTQFGGANVCSFPWYQYQKYSGVIFEYDTSNGNYNVLFNFDDTTTGCWPQSAPILAPNGKLYGVTPGIGGFSQHYGTVYSYELSTGTYTKIHSFGQNSDGENPVGNLLLASDGKLYGITSDGGYNDKGVIFTIDPATDTYTLKLDLQNGSSGNKAAQDARSGLIQSTNGKIYGTSESGGNYPNGYQYAFGNIFEYDPVTNIAINLYGFSNDSLGKNPEGAPVLVGTNELYCITRRYYQIPGTYNQEPHSYLWKYTISTGIAIVVDSIANGSYNSEILVNTNGKIIITGKDYNISSSMRFWEYNPSTNTKILVDTSANLSYIYKGLMLASNGKYYTGGDYYSSLPANTGTDGSFIEYDASNHTVTEKFKFSEPVDGINPEGDLIMVTNGKLYGMTSKGGANNKGVVFEFNPANDSYTKKFDLDSLTGYEPKGGLMEASNGKLYGLTSRGGDNSFGTIFEIDTNTWVITKKADFSNLVGIKPMGKMVEAWDGKLYGLTANNGGTIFQYDINTSIITNKHSFTYNDGTSPQGSLSLADNGKLYGLTSYGGQSYYSNGTLFEYDPTTSTFTMKKEMYNYTGYHSQGNTPLMGSDGKMYLVLSTGGSGNTEYEGGAIDEYIPGSIIVTNKANFSVSNTGSKPMGDLMESANGKLYGYAWIGGANNKGTIYEYNPSTAILTKKTDFNGTNGANPIHGSLTESNTSAIVINQQPSINTECIGDTTYLSIAAVHGTLLHYQWYKGSSRISGATNDTLFINGLDASDAGTYFCKITGGTKAVISNSIVVVPVSIPVVSISNLANEYCLNAADVNITATPSGGVFSGTGTSGSVFSASTAGAGNFVVLYTYTNAQSCSNTDTVNVTVNALPDASFSGYTSTYCNNYAVDTLVPTQIGGVFSGSGAITGNLFDPSYYVPSGWLFISAKMKYAITDANGCSNTDSVYVSIYPTPTVSISGLDNQYCHNADNDTAVVSPVGGTFTGNVLANNIYSPAIVGIDTLIYSFTNSNQCTDMDTVIITVNALPTVSIDNIAVSYCNNEADVQIQASPAGGLLTASSGLIGSVFSPAAATVGTNNIIYYYVDANTCYNYDTVDFDVFDSPTVDLGDDQTICINHTIDIDAGAGSNYIYLWNDGSTLQTLSIDAQILGVGTYTYSVVVRNSDGCEQTDSIDIIVEACTGIEHVNGLLDISIYPNPSNGKFYINLDGVNSGSVQMNIYTATGKVIISKQLDELNSKDELIDLSEMPTGIYYLNISDGINSINKKLIIK